MKSKRFSVEQIVAVLKQALSTRKAVHITDLPHDYLNVNSTLGSRKPASLLVSPITADNEVIGEVQRGYRLHDRVIRPSLVRVANNPKEH